MFSIVQRYWNVSEVEYKKYLVYEQGSNRWSLEKLSYIGWRLEGEKIGKNAAVCIMFNEFLF